MTWRYNRRSCDVMSNFGGVWKSSCYRAHHMVWCLDCLLILFGFSNYFFFFGCRILVSDFFVCILEVWNRIIVFFQEGLSELSSQNQHKVLLTVIHSRTLSTIKSNSSYGSVFSFLCYLVGKLSREFQEANTSSERRSFSCFGEHKSVSNTRGGGFMSS